MRTTVNPGAALVLEGSFELGQERLGWRVYDRESCREVTLGGLLRSFLEDPAEHVTGPIRITIESAVRPPAPAELVGVLRANGFEEVKPSEWLESARRHIVAQECDCDCFRCIRGEHHDGCRVDR